MAGIRDPDVFRASMAVMQDEGASAQARSTAVLIAVAQHDNAVGLSLKLPLTEALRSGQCRLVPFGPASYRSTTSLPADYRQQLGRAFYDLSSSPDLPDPLKSFVTCARPAMLAAIADAVPTSALRLSYLCGNRYQVDNQSTEGVELSLKVNGTKDKANLYLPAKETKTLTLQKRGSTRLYYRDKLVQTVANQGTACSR